jgi:hypothetical protein
LNTARPKSAPYSTTSTRRVDDVNNFWKYLARDPATLGRTCVKEVMAPGALDAVTKEMIYLAALARPP